MEDKLSLAMLEMAETILVDPTRAPSFEAAHAALLLASIAWNRSVLAEPTTTGYSQMLEELESSNPDFWRLIEPAH